MKNHHMGIGGKFYYIDFFLQAPISHLDSDFSTSEFHYELTAAISQIFRLICFIFKHKNCGFPGTRPPSLDVGTI